jgi:hypothetical protein
MKHFSNKSSSIIPFILNSRFNHYTCYHLAFKKAVSVATAIFILITLINGCLVLPIPYRSDDPFPDEKMSFIVPGTTTKGTVKEKLGTPSAYRLGERIYLYAGGQRDWLWYGGILIGGPYYATYEHCVMPTYLTHLLIIEFDKNDVVTAAQEFCGDSGELESGLYVINAGGYCTPITTPHSNPHSKSFFFSGPKEVIRNWLFSDKQLILRASHVMEKQAKQFTVPPNKSAIYFYNNFSDISEATLDDNLSVDSRSDGFLLWVVDPGEHRINTTHNFYWDALTIHCYPGEKYYIENCKGTLREEDKAIAENEISERKLVIDRLDTFNFD